VSHYITLLNYTPQGIAKIKETLARQDAGRKACEAFGGKILSLYLTMGEYDGLVISEFPNDEAYTKFTLSLVSLGNVSTHTLKAFHEDEYKKLIASLP
jgi:uncharacterized protein with GYD domain